MNESMEWTWQDWLTPPSIYRGAPFWSWNSRLEPRRLCEEIQAMHDAGMGGFFMHSRYGLKTPYLSDEWFECVSACVAKARELDMKAYLYDEDRWPSGAAGGRVTRDRPEFSAHLVVATYEGDLPDDIEPLGSFAVRLDPEGQLLACRALEEGQAADDDERAVHFGSGVTVPSPWFNEAPYLDLLNADAVAEFIRVTHQAYADRYGEDFGELIPAIFTDEPNYSQGNTRVAGGFASAPWTASLALTFRERRGYDLRDHLPALFFPPAPGSHGGFCRVRHDYWLTLTEMFVEAFSVQVGRWCSNHNIALTGHYLAEESFQSQIHVIGSAMPHYAHMQWPGIDILSDSRLEISTTKQCTSVAAQLGGERVLSETYGCTGWDWPLEGHRFNAGWQYVLGVNFRCPHLSLYSLAGGAKRDYPASIFPHSPWWKYYRVVEDHFARLGLVLTQGTPIRDVLILNVIESAYGLYQGDEPGRLDDLQNSSNALLGGLLGAHYDYDIGDESIMASHAKVDRGRLKVGRMEYRLVVVPPSITMRSTTVSLLKRFVGAGGSVLFVGRAPDRVDGDVENAEAAAGLSALREQSTRCGDPLDVVITTMEDLLPRAVSVMNEGRQDDRVWTMLRQVKGGRVLLAQSMDRDGERTVRISAQGRRPVVLMDTVTGSRRRVEAEVVGDRVEFDLLLPASGSALVSLGMLAGDAERPTRPARVVSAEDAAGPWPIKRLEPNTFPLDFCQARIAGGEWSPTVTVRDAETRIRQHFGLPVRGNQECQPWYLAETGRADRRKRGSCELRLGFHVTDGPAELLLAIERPQDYRIELNGRTVSNAPTGWWVDEDIKTVDLTAAAATGENELLLTFDYSSDMEIEELQLVGSFGVRRTGDRPVCGAYTLTTPPTELAAGSWVGQGLDFYGGAVHYRVKLPANVWDAVNAGRRIRVALPGAKGTCSAVHVGDETFVLAWAPMHADITEALLKRTSGDCSEIVVEVIGGRKNILGPLHVPWLPWTGPGEFDTSHAQWTEENLLTDHGLMAPPVIEIVE